MKPSRDKLFFAAAALIVVLPCCVSPAYAQTWNLLAPTGPDPLGRGFHRATSVYDASTDRMIMFGGHNAAGASAFHGNLNDVWVLTNANGLGGTPAWIQLLPSGQLPEPRSGHSAVYDTASNRMIVFGGCEFGCTPLAPPTVWVLTNANGLGGTPAWIQLQTGAGPAPRTEHAAVYDSGSNSMILFAGQDGGGSGCSTFSDVWVLSHANGLGGNPTWTQLTTSGGFPAGQYAPSATYDPASNRMMVFGGIGVVNGICQYSNAVWVLANANGTGGQPVWTNLIPEGAAGSPAARGFGGAVYDPTSDRFTIYGGATLTVDLSDVWVLSNANGLGGAPAWSQIFPSGTSPGARDSQTAVLDVVNDRMIVFGGEGPSGAPQNDVWILTNADGVVGTQLQISSVQPNHGGNAGTVSPTIIGSGFQTGAQVKLVGSGADIFASNVIVSDSETLIQATFDLFGMVAGSRDLVVINPDGTSASLSSAFTIDPGGSPQISAQIIGPTKVRFDKSATYYLEIANTGSVDSPAGLASLAVNSAVASNQMSGADLFVAGSTLNPDFAIPSTSTTNASFLLFATPAVPAGASVFAPVQLTLPSGSQVSSFVLTAGWQQDLINLSLDDFLGLEGIPFIPFPTNGCSACLNQYNAELQAHSDVLTTYNSYQTARGNFNSALVSLPVEIGKTVAAAFLVESTGITGLGGILLSEVIGELNLCAKNLYSDVTTGNKSCFQSLQGQLKIEANAIITALRNGLASAAQIQALKLMSIQVNSLVAAIDATGNIFDAYGAEQLALGTFQQSLGPYRLARAAYQNCLSPTTCSAPPLPPQPNPPGTSLPVTGVGSFDPNDKIGLQGAGPQGYVSGAAPFAYTVYFANKDTATAPAQQVVITDQLDAVNNDLSTFRFGPISFGNQFIPPLPAGQANFSTTLDLRPANNILVAIAANLSPSTGLLMWNFQSLDPSTSLPPTDPTAGFLPPGVGGSTFFTIAPKQGLPTNTQIQNQATIVFDTNPPINTPTWLNTLDKTPPSSFVQALPATEVFSSFNVQWSGSDVGAGVQDFTVYVSEDGGPFAIFLANTPSNSATFNGRDGHGYAFYSLARDFAGNIEPKSPQVEATTSTPSDSIPPTTFASLSIPPNVAGWNNSDVTVSLNSFDDPGGTGVKQITYGATGAQSVGSTALPTSSTSFIVTAEGITTVTFFGTDNAGNAEAAKTITVKIDKTPLVVTASANPSVLWPPNGKMVNVTVSGTIMDATSGVNPNSATFAVIDAYGIVQPSGSVAVSGNGSYSFTVALEARRSGNDQNGRAYTITVIAQDNAGNQSSASTAVVVPHDQGN